MRRAGPARVEIGQQHGRSARQIDVEIVQLTVVPRGVGRDQAQRQRGSEREQRLSPVTIERSRGPVAGRHIDDAARPDGGAAVSPHSGVRRRLRKGPPGKGAGDARRAGAAAGVHGDQPPSSAIDVRSEREVEHRSVGAEVQRGTLRHPRRRLERRRSVDVHRRHRGVVEGEGPAAEDGAAAQVERVHAPAPRRTGCISRDIEARWRSRQIRDRSGDHPHGNAVGTRRRGTEAGSPEDGPGRDASCLERVHRVHEAVAGGRDDDAEVLSGKRAAGDRKIVDVQG